MRPFTLSRTPRGWGLLLVGLITLGCDGPPPTVDPLRTVSTPSAVVALAYTADGQTLASRGADAIRLWDAATLKEQASWPSDGSPFGGLAISPDGQTLAAPLAGRGVVTWNIASHNEQATYRVDTKGPPGSAEAGTGVTFSPDGATLVGSTGDPRAPGSILLWNRKESGVVALGTPGSPATHLAFTPDGRTLVSKGMQGKVHVWNLATRTERPAIKADASYLAAISISPDGKLVATSGADRYLRSYRLDTGSDVSKLKGHLKAILGIAYHPSGRYIATGDSGGTIFLWDIAGSQVLAQLRGATGKVWALAFRPDGQELAAAGEDKVIRVWSVDQAIHARER